MVRLNRTQRLEKRAFFQEHGQPEAPPTPLTPAEEFERLAFEANEIEFSGPAFETGAALDPLEFARHFSFATERCVSLAQIDQRVAAAGLTSAMCARFCHETDIQLPGPFPQSFTSPGFDNTAVVSAYGDYDQGDGLSMHYIAPASHIKLFAWMTTMTPGLPPEQVYSSSWLPVVPNDPRTKLVVASRLWECLDARGRDAISFEELRMAVFSSGSKALKEKLSSSNLHPGFLQPGLWSGYRTTSDFSNKFASHQLVEAFKSIGFQLWPGALARLVVTHPLDEVIVEANRVVSTLATLPGMSLVPFDFFGGLSAPTWVQLVRTDGGLLTGPPGLTVFPQEVGEYESNTSACLERRVCYTNVLGLSELLHNGDESE